MAGRRRRGTNSSTESVALDQLRYRTESTVLKPVSPDTPEDNWPTFELDDAVILGKDGRKLENALDVILNGPFIVRGRMLLEDEEQRSHLVTRVRAPVPIEIWPCQRYSIGEAEGGKPSHDGGDDDNADAPPIMSVLWVSGQGGWFEVNPAPAYLPIYRNICDAIKLFYAIYDIYFHADTKFRSAENGAKDPTERLAPLFLKYAVRAGSGLTVEEVEKRCLDVAPFLISQFLDDLNFWKKTYLYQWFKDTHEDIWKKISHFKRNPKPITADRPPVEMPVTSTLPTRTRNESSTPVVESLATTHRSSSRARSTRSASFAIGPQTHAPVQVAPPALTTSTRRTPREDAGSHTAVATQIVQEATVQSPQAEEAIDTSMDGSAFGTILPVVSATLDNLAESKRGVTFSKFVNKIYFDHKFPNYKNGQSGSFKIPVEEVLHYNARELLDRIEPKYHGTEVYTWLQEKSTTPFQPIAIDLSDFPYTFVPRRKKAPRGQNELVDRATANNAGSSLDRETASNPRSQSPRAGKGLKMPGRRPKKSSLRPTSSKKRPFSEVESGSESETSETGPKKSHFFQDGDESMEEAANVNLAHKPENAVRIVIQADKIPSTVPKGHHGAWTCEQDDCDYIVRGADAEECQTRIRAHFEHHEQQEERVQLAITEGTRGHTQINNLLEKIKRLGEKQQPDAQPQLAPRNGVVVTQRIKTNLIV